jgi:hypothetical protein
MVRRAFPLDYCPLSLAAPRLFPVFPARDFCTVEEVAITHHPLPLLRYPTGSEVLPG